MIISTPSFFSSRVQVRTFPATKLQVSGIVLQETKLAINESKKARLDSEKKYMNLTIIVRNNA